MYRYTHRITENKYEREREEKRKRRERDIDAEEQWTVNDGEINTVITRSI